MNNDSNFRTVLADFVNGRNCGNGFDVIAHRDQSGHGVIRVFSVYGREVGYLDVSGDNDEDVKSWAQTFANGGDISDSGIVWDEAINHLVEVDPDAFAELDALDDRIRELPEASEVS